MPCGKEKSSIQKLVKLINDHENRHRLGGALDLRNARSRLLDQPQKRTALHCSISGEWDHQVAVDKGPQSCRGQGTAVYGYLHRVAALAKLAKIGSGSPSQIKHRHTKDAILYEIRCGNGSQ